MDIVPVVIELADGNLAPETVFAFVEVLQMICVAIPLGDLSFQLLLMMLLMHRYGSDEDSGQ